MDHGQNEFPTNESLKARRDIACPLGLPSKSGIYAERAEGAELFAGPIQNLFDWHDENGPATDLKAQIAGIDLADTAATLRLELDNWTGHRFTDLFTLLKVDGEWKIMNKVFHLHPENKASGA